MRTDIEKGISLEVEGELGKFQTLPVDTLIEISKNFQELVLTVAKFDKTTEGAISFNNFKIEITDFVKSSAVPIFALTKRIEPTIFDLNKQRKELSESLDNLFQLTDKGNYSDIKELYPDPLRRNEIIERMYAFTNSFGSSPVRIGRYKGDGEFENTYKVRKLTSKIKKNILVKIEDDKAVKGVDESALAHIVITTKGNKVTKKIETVLHKDKHSLSYSPNIINVNNKQYVLTDPLLSTSEVEEGVYTITNTLLDIIGVGLSIEDAEESFNQEFDYLYQRLNTSSNDELSKRFIRIKDFISYYVKEVKSF